nr:glycosyltransferase [uncultured Acetatifactor sp.]
MSIKSMIKEALTERENKRYEKELEKRRVTYGQWCRLREEAGTALEASSDDQTPPKVSGKKEERETDYVLLDCGRGNIAKRGEVLIAEYFARHPQVQILYGDEDVWENFPNGERHTPWFKPDWSPDLFESCFYFGSLTAVRRKLYEKICPHGKERTDRREMIRRCVEMAGGRERGCKTIGHISEILFHCESREAILEFTEKQREAPLEESLMRGHLLKAGEKPEISVVIPSKDHPETLEVCMKSLEKAMGGLSYETIVVDNGSSPENKKILDRLLVDCTYLYRPMEFHFSEMCNLGAEQARGRFLLFLNDDVEMRMDGCIRKLAASASRPHVGAVGMKLYYPDSIRIQHAGIVNLPMGPVHKLQFLEDAASYYFGSNKGVRNVLAVTGACLMVEREKFFQAGGFASRLRVAFNDVDLCFRLWEMGYFNVCRNDLHAFHHESLSRGDDEAEEKLKRLLEERDALYKGHPKLMGLDPFYSVHLGRQGLDTRIRPAFETAGNRLQEKRGRLGMERLAGCRQDACLLFRVEFCQDGVVQGFGAVLGDNNACYKRSLLFEAEGGDVFSLKLQGQYRPDLAENMPDQNRVGLCGFWVRLGTENLPEGEYQIGMKAENKVTGLKLLWWSSRKIRIGA